MPDAVLMGDLEEKAKRADSCAETSEARNPGMTEAEPKAETLPKDLNYDHPITYYTQQR